MQVSVELAPLEDKDIIRRLLELYIYDFTEFLPIEIGERGEFGYSRLDQYWAPEAGETRLPYLIRVDGKLAGFALVWRREGGPSEMAEFFVLRSYRRTGLGSRAARTLFERHPGEWKVSQVTANMPAQTFWRRIIGEFTGGQYSEETSGQGVTQRFVAG